MPTTVACPHCLTALLVPDGVQATRVRCRSCKQPIDLAAALARAATDSGDGLTLGGSLKESASPVSRPTKTRLPRAQQLPAAAALHQAPAAPPAAGRAGDVVQAELADTASPATFSLLHDLARPAAAGSGLERRAPAAPAPPRKKKRWKPRREYSVSGLVATGGAILLIVLLAGNVYNRYLANEERARGLSPLPTPRPAPRPKFVDPADLHTFEIPSHVPGPRLEDYGAPPAFGPHTTPIPGVPGGGPALPPGAAVPPPSGGFPGPRLPPRR